MVPQRLEFGIFMAPFHRVGENPTLAQGVNIRQGKVTNPAVAETFGLECITI